jgi:hypothetical protein
MPTPGTNTPTAFDTVNLTSATLTSSWQMLVADPVTGQVYRAPITTVGTSLTSIGALTLNGTLSAAAFTPAIAFSWTTSLGTAALYGQIINSGASMILGTDNSVGGGLAGGSSAYAVVIGNQANNPLQFSTNNIVRVTISATGTVTTSASAAAAAGFNVPHGAAPTAPVNGDVWSTTLGLFIRVNGVTKTVTLT